MEFLINNLAPIMFAGLIVFLLMGFPVAFSLGACGLFFGFVGIELGVLPEALLQALPLRLFGIMQNDTLLAIPFFTLMGLILERSGMAEDCSTPSASYSAPCAVAWALRSFWSVPCWRQPRVWWRLRSFPWD